MGRGGDDAGWYLIGEPAYRALGPTEDELDARDEDEDAVEEDAVGRLCTTVETET